MTLNIKIPQPNTSKPNLATNRKDYIYHDQMGFLPAMQNWINMKITQCDTIYQQRNEKHA